MGFPLKYQEFSGVLHYRDLNPDPVVGTQAIAGGKIPQKP